LLLKRMEASTQIINEIKSAMLTCKNVVFASCVSGTMTSLGIQREFSRKSRRQSNSPPHPAAFGRDPLPVEVGCFRLRSLINGRTRINPSSAGERVKKISARVCVTSNLPLHRIFPFCAEPRIRKS
jgi:hypothetical protein